MAAHLTSLGPQGGVAFSAFPATPQGNIAINSLRTIVLGTEIFDVGGNFASNTFTAPVTGKYQLNGMVRVNEMDSAATYYQTYMKTSNRIYFTTIYPSVLSGDASYWSQPTTSVLADMDASDTAFYALYQAAGTAQTDITEETYFSGFLVA